MGRIDDTFRRLRKERNVALITFITAGDPELGVTERLIPRLAEAGADIIELGVPFSDPMADGPTIQRASERALSSGTSLEGILAMVRRVRAHCQVPLVLMGYFNPILQYGTERFARDAVDAGVDGVLLVDLPPEEAEEFRKSADHCGLRTIFLLTPTSDDARIRKVLKMGSGFLYYVSVTGVTGARQQVAVTVAERVAAIRQKTRLPVVVGFGVSTPDQAAQLALQADGVVVGSALVKHFEELHGPELEHRLADSVAALKNGMITAKAARFPA
jgi:tryptophan synthase alpha chain